MNKRSFLKSVASTCLVAPFLKIRHSVAGDSYRLEFFSMAQMQVLERVCDILLPETNTPSAAQVGTHFFIDHKLALAASQGEADAVAETIARLDVQAKSLYGKSFVDITKAEARELVEEVDFGVPPVTALERSQFKTLKRLVGIGYYTSKLGATKELAYDAIPGEFVGSIDFSVMGKNWSSYARYYI